MSSSEIRRPEDFKKALIDIAKSYKTTLLTAINCLEDTYLNTKDKRLNYAKELRSTLDHVHHFILEEERLQKEDNIKNGKTN